jgi:hypothetical protein
MLPCARCSSLPMAMASAPLRAEGSTTLHGVDLIEKRQRLRSRLSPHI